MGLSSLTAMLMACSPSKLGSGSSSASSVSPSAQYQAPQVNGVVKNMSDNSVMMNVSSLTSANNLSKPAVAPALVQLDLSKSVAPSGTALTAQVMVGTVVQTASSPMKYSLNFPISGSQSITITLTDGLGIKSITKFSIPVSCDSSKLPAIALNMGALSITKSGLGGAGFVNVSVPAASGGSGAGFLYAIDLNGDGRYDDFNNNYWNSASSWSNMYTLYNGTRTVSVTVYDTGCEFEKTFTAPVNYANILDPIQSGATASTSTPYYYLQANVASASNSGDLAEGVTPFDAMDQHLANQVTHVNASYPLSASGPIYNGDFSMQGSNIYSDGNTDSSVESKLMQDMTLGFQVTGDTGAAGTQNFSNVSVSTLNYLTAGDPDGIFQQYTYSVNAGCKANIVITRSQTVTTCTSGSGVVSTQVTISGTFGSCSLSSSTASSPTARNLNISNGYFYVQVAPADNCVGGGQEGGTPPPAF